MTRKYEEVGVVRRLTRFPVKSMAGGDTQEARLGWHGIDGDRRFAFLKSHDKSGFPWFTVRDYRSLVQYAPYFVDPSNVRESAIQVKTPSGGDLPVDSDSLLDELRTASGKDIQLVQNWSGVFDAMDISMISTESIASLESIVGQPLDHRRFRSNIMITTSPYVAREYPEDKFVGNLIKFGDRDDSATIRIKRKDIRCMVVNVDPLTATQTPGVLKEIVNQRKNNLGVYATTERPGTIKVGDVLWMTKE